MLYLDRYSLIELWRKWYEYAGAVQVPPVNILIVPFSYLFLAPDRSCSVNPETNISNIVRKDPELCVKRGIGSTVNVAVGYWRDRYHKDGELDHNLSKIVGIFGPVKEANIACRPVISMLGPETEFSHV